MRRTQFIPALVLTALIVPWHSGLAGGQGSLVGAQDGTAGIFAIGEAITNYESQVLQQTPQLFLSQDNTFRLVVDESGAIAAIETSSPLAFTERLVRPQGSCAEDVFRSYGKLTGIRLEEGQITFRFESYEFLFDRTSEEPELTPEEYQQLLSRPLASMRLVGKVD